jgi:hypothetical protein
MATNVVDIDQVPPDIDDLAVGVIKNPLTEDFSHEWAGKMQTIPAATVEGKVKVEGRKQFPLPVAVHLAKHLAEKIIRDEFRKKIAAIKDPKEKELESGKPIPDYKGRIWEKMKELVETDSDFFEEKGLGNDGNKEKFIK